MTDAPERIWLTTTNSGRVDEFTMWLDDQSQLPPEAPRTAYIRADLHDAQLAALREENRELAMQIIASDEQAHDAYSETLALRDRVEALSAEVERLTALVPRPEQTDDEILWRDYMRGTPYERLAKERGVTRERMRHRLNDIARRLLALRGLEKP